MSTVSNSDIKNSFHFDFWFYIIGVNCIPFDSKNKTTYEPWSKWQNHFISTEVFERWKVDGSFNKGIAIIPGKIWRGDHQRKYLTCIDIDNKKGARRISFKLWRYQYFRETISKDHS